MARAIFKILSTDDSRFKDVGYHRATDHEDKIKTLINQLRALVVDIRHEGHQKIVSQKKVQITKDGVQIA